MPASASKKRSTRNRRRGSFEYWGGQNGEPPDQIQISKNLQQITPVPNRMEETDTPEPTGDT